jgi:hypothetical protein
MDSGGVSISNIEKIEISYLRLDLYLMCPLEELYTPGVNLTLGTLFADFCKRCSYSGSAGTSGSSGEQDHVMT